MRNIDKYWKEFDDIKNEYQILMETEINRLSKKALKNYSISINDLRVKYINIYANNMATLKNDKTLSKGEKSNGENLLTSINLHLWKLDEKQTKTQYLINNKLYNSSIRRDFFLIIPLTLITSIVILIFTESIQETLNINANYNIEQMIKKMDDNNKKFKGQIIDILIKNNNKELEMDSTIIYKIEFLSKEFDQKKK